jgi:hypothetical protein
MLDIAQLHSRNLGMAVVLFDFISGWRVSGSAGDSGMVPSDQIISAPRFPDSFEDCYEMLRAEAFAGRFQ